MTTVNIQQAKTQLSRLLAALRGVEAGEEVVIVRNGSPVARLVSKSMSAGASGRFMAQHPACRGCSRHRRRRQSFFERRGKRRFGALRIAVDDLPEVELSAWEG